MCGRLLSCYFNKSQEVTILSQVLEGEIPPHNACALYRDIVIYNINGQEIFVVVIHWNLELLLQQSWLVLGESTASIPCVLEWEKSKALYM